MTRRPEDEPVSRSDLRYARAWILATRGRIIFVLLLMVAGGVLSVLGLLTPQEPLMRWSFAVLCWGVAAYLAGSYARGQTGRKD